jgi:hypothetical protein
MFTMTASRKLLLERLLIAALALALVATLPVFLYRALNDTGGTDFPEFHDAGRYVLDHAARQPDSILHRYLPSVDVAWALFGWLPLPAAATIYYAFSFLTWVGLLNAIGRYLLPATPAPDRRIVLLTAALLTLVFTIDHLLLGAFHLLMLWLMVAGLGRVMRGHTVTGSLLLGLAVWLKLLPLLGVGYLLVKRKWLAALAAVGVALLLNTTLSLAAYGPPAAWSAHVRWWHTRAVGDLNTTLTAERFTAQQRDRNQSTAAVLRRLLRPAPILPPGFDHPDVSLANLTARQLKVAYYATATILAGALIWTWRRSASASSPPQIAAEIALAALATMWFSPIVFSYHPTAALPALAVILGSRWERSRLKILTLVVWLLAMVLLAFPAARAAGDLLWASLLLGLTVGVIAETAARTTQTHTAATDAADNATAPPG